MRKTVGRRGYAGHPRGTRRGSSRSSSEETALQVIILVSSRDYQFCLCILFRHEERLVQGPEHLSLFVAGYGESGLHVSVEESRPIRRFIHCDVYVFFATLDGPMHSIIISRVVLTVK